jgi:hypothetical protein
MLVDEKRLRTPEVDCGFRGAYCLHLHLMVEVARTSETSVYFNLI